MEKAAYILVCIAAIIVIALIVMVIIAVLKVASDKDDEYEMTERINFEAREGLRNRGNEVTSENIDVSRRDP